MSTSSTVAFYKGYYAGGTPTVLSANPFDVAQDLSTGNLWQYTGGAWVAPSWQTSITFWLGAADTVCARLNSPDTKIPSTIQVYYGTADQVPPELNLSADDVAIHHGIGNYNLVVNVLRRDVTTDTVVDVPFPEGYIISTDDGNWTIIKNFTKCVGYDYATVSLSWTTTADGTGPQSVDYVTSGAVTSMIESAIGSGGTVSGALISGAEINTTVGSTNLQVTSSGFALRHDDSGLVGNVDSLSLVADHGRQLYISGDGGVVIHDTFPAALVVDGGEIHASATQAEGQPGILDLFDTSAAIRAQSHNISIDSNGITADSELIATRPWVLANTSNTGVTMPAVEVVANNTALAVLQSGGAAQELSEVTVYFDSGYIDYIEDYPQTYIGSKAITLTKSGGSCVAVFNDEVWASAYNPDQGEDVIVTLNGSMYTVHSGNTVVVSADAQYAFMDNSYPLQGPVVSSIDGGFTWQIADDAADIPWCAYGYARYAEGSGYPQSASATFAPNDNRVSGALLSNAEIDTTVGGYRLTYTSSGGLIVSGGGVQLQVSSGGIVASMNQSVDEDVHWVQLAVSSGAITASNAVGGQLTFSEGGIMVETTDGLNGASVSIEDDSATLVCYDGVGNWANAKVTPTGVTVNSRPVLTELVTSTDTTTTSAMISVLSGGTSYIYTQPLTSLDVASVTNTTLEDRLQFTLASNASGTPSFPASCGICPSGFTFEGGKSYLVAVMGGNVIAAEYQPGVTE